MRIAWILVASATLLAAGCATPPPSTSTLPPGPADPFPAFVPPAPDFDFSTVIDPDHAHEIPELHTGGHGVTVVGHVGIQDILPVGTRGSITQVDLWGDYAVVSGMEGGLAFAIIDLKDPTAPKAISWYPSTADGWTARFSDDGNYVFYGCQRLAEFNPTSAVQGTCEDPSPTNIHSPPEGDNGIVAVNVTDKAHPTFAAFLPVSGSHNIQTANINGTDYIVTEITEIVAFHRENRTMEVVATVPGVHDATAQRHPVTGDWLLYTGAASSFTIYNINNPADPQQVYEGQDSDPWTGWHEQTPIPHLVDGRALVILAGESFVGIPQEGGGDQVAVVNVTDPAKPTLLGSWHLPIRPLLPWEGYMFSAHEIAATPTGQVAMGWYHGGAWVFDVSTKERQQNPVTLAAFQPHDLPNVVPSTFAQVPVPLVPFVWGAGWTHDGYLVIPDMHTGVYVLKPDWGLVPALDGGQ